MSKMEDPNATIPRIFTVVSDSESDPEEPEEGTYYGQDFTQSISQEKISSPKVIRVIINLVSSDSEDLVQEIETPVKRTRLSNSRELGNTSHSLTSTSCRDKILCNDIGSKGKITILESLMEMFEGL